MMNEKQRKGRQARYSLYSTDTEDQVASTHRGLDRCAALLKSLLSPEKGLPLKQQPSLVRRRPAPCYATDSRKITKASTAGKTKDPGAPKTPEPRFPGASRHPPPPASSPPEPSIRHPGARTDSKRAGKPLGTVGKSPRGEAPAGSVRRVRVMSQPRVAESGRMKSARRLLVAHRRLRTEPGRRTSEVRSRGEPGRRTTDVSAATSRGVRSNQLEDKNVHLFASLGNTNGAQTGNVVFSRANQPADGASSAARGSVPSDLNPPGMTSAPQAPPPSLGYRYPYAVPPLPLPSSYAYYPPFWPYFHPSAPFALPISSQGLAPSQTLHPGPAHTPSPLRSSSLPHLAQTQAQSHAKPFPGLNSRSNLGCGHKNPDATVTVQSQHRTDHSNKSTPVTTSNAMATVETPTTALTVTSSASASRRGPVPGAARDCEVLQCAGCPGVLHCRTAGAVRVLAEEMLCSVTDSVVRIRGTAGTANAELLKSLQDLEDTQKSYRECLTALCVQIQGAHGVVGGGIPHSAAGWMEGSSLPSAADWLAQLQQLESEKTHLLERVVQSEMAYSETKGLLDQAEEKAGHLRKELEEQLLSLKSELVMTSEALRTVRGEKTAVEEELERVKTVEVKFTAQTAALERQVSSLEQQLSGSKEALCRSGDQLSAVRCALETGREERQMLQLSLAEKETELVQAQDRLLGLRQCLAYFLSDVVKLDAPLHHNHHQATCTCTGQHSPPLALHYRVPQEAVQRLQSLVNEGNVERFLAAYNSLPLRDSEGSPLASLHDSPTPINTSSPLLSKSTLRSSLQLSPSHSLQLSPTHSLQPGPTHLTPGMTSSVQLCTGGDGSLNCAHMDSDCSTTVAGGDSPESTEAKPGPPENSQLRTAFEVALFQQPGSEVLNEPSHVVHTTAAHNKVSHPHALRNSSPKSPASNRSGSGAASVTATDLHSASVLTTSSEVEFRRDLASLDADIARLQMQFRVAMQRQPRPTHL